MNSALLHPPLAIFGLGTPELIGIVVVILLLFGGTKLPSLARGLGQSIKEFKKASKEVDKEDESAAAPKDSKKTVEPTKTHGSN